MYFEYEELIRDRDAFEYDDFISQYQTRVEANLIEKLLPAKAETILDAGCGTGRFINLLMQNYHSPEKTIIYHGIDLSKESLKMAEKKLQRYDNVKYNLVKNSITSLPFESNYYDLIICSQVFEHILDKNDQLNTLKELKRCLKPRGVLILTTFCYSIFDRIRKTPKVHTASDGKVPNYIKLIKKELLDQILPEVFKKEEIESAFGGLCLYRIPKMKHIYPYCKRIIESIENIFSKLPFSFFFSHLIFVRMAKRTNLKLDVNQNKPNELKNNKRQFITA